jgi:outer membrane protein assembly factor BamB
VLYGGTGTATTPTYTPPAASPTTPYSGTDQAVAYQVDPAHSGAQPQDSLTPPLKQQWAIDFAGPVSYPLIAGGKVFATVRNDAPPDTNAAGTALYALDESSGHTVWGPTDLGGGLWSGATYENGRVFAQNNNDLMRAFEAGSGNQLWAAQLPWGQDEVAPPTARGGTVYAAGYGHDPGGGWVAALKQTDGMAAWPTFVSTYGGRSSPAVSASDVYLSTYFNAIDLAASSGQARWTKEGTVGLTTVLAGGRLYERGPGYTANNIIHDAASGERIGSFDSDLPPAFDGNRGFFIASHTLAAKDMTTLPGSPLWSFTGDGGLDSAPLVVHGMVYIGSASGMLYGLDEATGQVRWSTNVGAPIAPPDEQNYGIPTTGMAAGEGLLVVAAGSRLIAYVSGSSSPPGCSPATAGSTSLTNPYTAVSTAQYHLTGSDGQHWQVMDPNSLSLTVRPPRDSMVLVTGNADLWTANAGYNQDLGIWVSGGDYGTGQVVSWKESGGYAGTFSPNAAFVQGVVELKGPDLNTGAITTYVIRLVWKTNRPAAGATIYAGAGPIGGRYSPTRLTAHMINIPSTNGNPWVGSSSSQYSLADSNGRDWQAIDATNLSVSLTVGAPYQLLVRGNADLWTEQPGYNQDLGIFISAGGGPDQLLAWKESGGFAGTFSPNAAAVQAVTSLTPGTNYRLTLRWKTNKPANGATIHAGAGPLNGQYSPTTLIAWLTVPPQGTFTATSTRQYQLSNSDGATWQPLDDPSFRRTVAVEQPVAVMLHASADLWTANSGYNQDLAIFVSVDNCPAELVAWKESGGSAGTFSPNAAFLQSVMTLVSGKQYVFSLRWKTNRPAAGRTIAAGAGPIGGQYSPTSLSIEEVEQPPA